MLKFCKQGTQHATLILVFSAEYFLRAFLLISFTRFSTVDFGLIFSSFLVLNFDPKSLLSNHSNRSELL